MSAEPRVGAAPDGIEGQKRVAAAQAVARAESGMRLGLGTGSTVAHFLELLAERIASGDLTDVVGAATSFATEERCRELGIPVGGLADLAPLDLAVDGADEISPALDLVKGMGGALLREKMVASQALRFAVIADERKLVDHLGARSPLPVEVVPFAWRVHLAALESLGARPVLREAQDGEPYRTDNGNLILDCRFPEGIADARGLERTLRGWPGVVETGLFLGMADEAFVATDDGIEHRVAPAGARGAPGDAPDGAGRGPDAGGGGAS